jgi:hypothetical protein
MHITMQLHAFLRSPAGRPLLNVQPNNCTIHGEHYAPVQIKLPGLIEILG